MSERIEALSGEVQSLVDEFLDGTISDDQVLRLGCALRDSAMARAYFLQYMQLHIEIGADVTVDERAAKAFGDFCSHRDQIADVVGEIVGGHKSSTRVSKKGSVHSASGLSRSIVRRTAVVFALGIPALLLCYEGWLRPRMASYFNTPPIVASNSAPIENVTSSRVARLTYLNGCSWGGGAPQFTSLDSQVRLGDEITLYEGIAEFRLSSGVSLSIEGPASLVLTSPTSLVLQHGRTTVLVPSDVKNFRLLAGSCRIGAREAEFGVRVTGGDVDMHVFAGQISAAPALLDERAADYQAPVAIEYEEDLPAGAEFSNAIIADGRGLSLSGRDGAMTVSGWHLADESQFATRLTMAGPLPIRREYVDAVLASNPMGYWRFENTGGGVVKNELGSVGRLHVSGDVRLVGDSHNHALELGHPGLDGALYCENEINLPAGSDYSVEVWMKPSHVHNGSMLGLVVGPPLEAKEGAAMYLHTANMGSKATNTWQRVRFLHRDPPSGDSRTGSDCYSSVPYRVRRWQHVVAVKAGAEMRLYLDGVLVDTNHDESSLASRLYLIIGQLSASRTYPFIGQLDELAIYARALSAEEIATHFNLVDRRPQETVEIRDKGI